MYLHTIGLIILGSIFFRILLKTVDELFSKKEKASIELVLILAVSVIFYLKYYITHYMVK
ncbi:MAG: hypothetical protein JXR88_12465 [Clostridia bacterium]|nr:hypothetical protein [Clostridia bacterium]